MRTAPLLVAPAASALAAIALLVFPGAPARAANAEARIEIDPGRPSRPISRKLFGKFTEHLGRNIYGGMWAQVLTNPGFEGPEFFGSREGRRPRRRGEGLAAHWRPLGEGAASYRLEEDCALPGQKAQAIAVEKVEEGRAAGILQEPVFLPLHRESDYRISLLCRGEGMEKGFAVSVRRDAEVLARAAFPPPGKGWERREASISIPRGSVAPGAGLAIAVEPLAPGTLVLDLLEVFPYDAIDGFDRDVVLECRKARLPLLRYPGGNFASGYRWREGIGPRERRPIRKNPAWDVVEYNHVGTDEYMDFCRAVGCEPMICVNAGDGTPEEATAWVEYTNGPVTSPLGELRARNGHPEPYGIKIWEVGNELYGDWQIGHCTAEEYAARYLRFSKAMNAADPSIDLIANGCDGAWNRKVLERCGAEVRSLSVHPLIGGGTPAGADPAAVFRALIAYPTRFEREAREDAAWARERGLSPRVAVTELQIFTNLPSQPSNATLSEALFLGRFIHAAVRLEGTVELITHSALVNHGGGLAKWRGVVVVQPVQHAHVLYATMTGVRPVPVDVTCGTYASRESNVPPVEGAPDLDAIALLDGSGRELTLVAINARAEGEIAAPVVLRGGAPARPVRARRIDGPSFMTRNAEAEPLAAALRSIDPPVDGAGRLHLPPHSITELVFEMGAGGPASPSAAPRGERWSFDGGAAGSAPAGLETTSGEWKVETAADAPSPPNVAVQTARSERPVFNVALVKGTSYRDVRIQVRLQAVSGEIDQGGGLVWRALDGKNYFICRWNPLERNLRLYKVVAGKRTQLATADVDAGPGWHGLEVVARGDSISCSLDGKKLLEARDAEFPEAGMVGLWTKADARTRFDDLAVEPIEGNR
jgi:alpha-N-arabinofuranosidase